MANKDRLREELQKSLINVLDIGGRAWLAYPDGRWSDIVKNVALEVGFKRLFTLNETSSIINDSDHYYRQFIGGDSDPINN